MNGKLLIILSCLWLSSCCLNPNLYKNYCSKDYWGDTQFEIFGRKSCVGYTGHWVTERGGWDGYFCETPRCKIKAKAACTDTCCGY